MRVVPSGIRRLGSQTVLAVAAAAILVSIAGYQFANGQESLGAYKFSRDSQQGKAIAPVTLNLEGKNPDLVYLGSYLVNAQADCVSCHTCPSYKGLNPYALGGAGLSGNPKVINTENYMAGGTPFPGRGAQGSTITAPNLTPDSSGLPGGMTYDDFKNAMQNGMVSSKPGHVLQVMPWPAYRNMYENDLVAIYQYLGSIPPAQPGACSMQGQAGN